MTLDNHCAVLLYLGFCCPYSWFIPEFWWVTLVECRRNIHFFLSIRFTFLWLSLCKDIMFCQMIVVLCILSSCCFDNAVSRLLIWCQASRKHQVFIERLQNATCALRCSLWSSATVSAWHDNPLRAIFFSGNKNIYLHVITPYWHDTCT